MYEGYRSRSCDGGGSYGRPSPSRRRRYDERSEQRGPSPRNDQSTSPPRSPRSRSRDCYQRGDGSSAYDRDGRDDRTQGLSSRGRQYGFSRQYQDHDGRRSRPETGGRYSPRPGVDCGTLVYDDVPQHGDGQNSPVHGLAAVDGGYRGSGLHHRHDEPRNCSPAARAQPPRLARDHRSPVQEHRDSHRLSYSRSPSHSPVRGGAPPRTLILEGLPPEITEQDIIYGLDEVSESTTFSSERIKVVRVRSSKKGRRIAFVEFFHIADAEDFMDCYYPSIAFTLQNSRDADPTTVCAGINFSRSRDDNGREEGSWKCIECFAINYGRRNSCYRCNMERIDPRDGYGPHAGMGPVLTGETDEDPQQQPSQFLVIRDLEASVTEETLAKGITKLYLETAPAAPKEPLQTQAPNKLKSTAPSQSSKGLGARPDSLNRIFLMRDRQTKESWRYGFAEFATVEDAQGALAKYRASPKFTISSKPVVVAFIHTGVFVPLLEAVTPETEAASFMPTYNSTVRLKYWDERAYPSVLRLESSILNQPSADPDNPSASGKATMAATQGAQGPSDAGRKSKKEKDKDPAAAAKKAAALAMAPQMQMWAKKRAELHGAPGANKGYEADGSGSANAVAPLEDARPGPRLPYPMDNLISYGDYEALACLLCGRRYDSEQDLRDHEILDASHLAKLKDEAKTEPVTKKLADLGKDPQAISRRVPRDRAARAPVYISYADTDSGHCLLCQRRFKRLAMLRLHERESVLHRKNMARTGNIERAVSELAKLGKKPVKMRPQLADRDQNRYRDRARERRQVYSQPKKPAAAHQPGRRANIEKPSAAAAAAAAAAALPSKGASLLGKMGWSSGQGLGAEGTGRTEAIATELYVPGVGLGAEGGKLGDAAAEAARKTQGHYSDFVEKTKDKARERYDRLE